jgi:hypothetical protein
VLSRRAPGWITSSLGHTADTLPTELSELGAHLRACHGTRGRLFLLQCGGEAVRGFFGARIVTSLLVAVALIDATSLAR